MTVILLPLFLALSAPGAPEAQPPAREPVHHLSIGDPARKSRDVTLVLDGIADTTKGDVIATDQLAARLAAVRLVLVGETHTSTESHRVQLQVIQALRAAGRKVLIGLEMFPYPEQPSLDRWTRGLYTEEGFVELARWYEHWGYHWFYYRDIFRYARDHSIPMYAVNAPRELVTAVRRKGLANLAPEEAARMPPRVDTESADHLTLFKAALDEEGAMHGGGMTEEAWKSMQAAQATWDAAMAWNAVQALKQPGHEQAIMVVLVGSGHVAYGLGIERQARAWFDGPVATVIGVPMRDDKGASIAAVRASYANFVWGVAYEPDSAWPSVGISTTAGEGGRRKVIDVQKDTPGAAAGVKVGDEIVSADGQPMPTREAFNRLMAGKAWGDTVRLVVGRDGAEVPVTILLRRTAR